MSVHIINIFFILCIKKIKKHFLTEINTLEKNLSKILRSKGQAARENKQNHFNFLVENRTKFLSIFIFSFFYSYLETFFCNRKI